MKIYNLGNKKHQVYRDNCFKKLQDLINLEIKVDAIICDMPFGVTNNEWDKKLDLELIWKLLKQLRKSATTPIVLFADKKSFETELYLSNPKWFRYEWYWNKKIATGFLDVAYQPLKCIEKIMVFIEKPYTHVESKETWKKYDRIAQYFPQFSKGKPLHGTGNSLKNNNSTYGNFKTKNEIEISYSHKTKFYREGLARVDKGLVDKHPKNLIEFQKPKSNKNSNYHPTEKPLDLMEYLVKTYSTEGQIILDFTAGSGSLMEACKNTNRKSISIELEEKYINMILFKLNK